MASNNRRINTMGHACLLGRFFVMEYNEFLKLRKVFFGFMLDKVLPPK